MVDAIGRGYAIVFWGLVKDLKRREWVGGEQLYEGVEKDGTRTLMHGGVRTHCTARTRVYSVKMQRRVIHVAGVRQVANTGIVNAPTSLHYEIRPERRHAGAKLAVDRV